MNHCLLCLIQIIILSWERLITLCGRCTVSDKGLGTKPSTTLSATFPVLLLLGKAILIYGTHTAT